MGAKHYTLHLGSARRRARAAELRADGMSLDEIGREMGPPGKPFHKATVYRWLARALTDANKAGQQVVEQLRDEQWAETELLMQRYFPLALDGDMEAATQVKWILERRAKLYGLDGAQRVIVGLDDEIDQLMAIVAAGRQGEAEGTPQAALNHQPAPGRNGSGPAHEADGSAG